MGGESTSVLLGIQVGMTNFIVTQLILRLIPQLKCQNLQTQSMLISSFIFFYCFINAAIFPVVTTNLQIYRYIIMYGRVIYTGMLVTSVMQYLVPFIGIIYFASFKKQPPPITKLHPIE